jgi:Insertion element 4 transposase N-terminal
VTHNGVVAAGDPSDGLDLARGAGLLGSKGSCRCRGRGGDEDYEELAIRLTETLASRACWDDSWSVPTSDGITQARQRLGPEALGLLFGKGAEPVAKLLSRGRSCAAGG